MILADNVKYCGDLILRRVAVSEAYFLAYLLSVNVSGILVERYFQPIEFAGILAMGYRCQVVRESVEREAAASATAKDTAVTRVNSASGSETGAGYDSVKEKRCQRD